MSSPMDGGSAGRQECKLGKGQGNRGDRGEGAAGRMQRQRPSSRLWDGTEEGKGRDEWSDD